MNKLFLIILIFFNVSATAQSALNDIKNYKKIQLTNGLTVISVPSTQDSLLYISLFSEFNPQIYSDFPGIIDVICDYENFSVTDKNILVNNKIISKDAIDSTFIFLNNLVANPDFTAENVKKVINFEKKKIKFLKNSQKEHQTTTEKFCYGMQSPLAVTPDTSDFDMITAQTLSQNIGQIFNPANSYLVVVGNVNPDTVFFYAKKDFKNWQQSTSNPFDYQQELLQNPEIFFISNPNTNFVSVTYPVDFFYTDNDFFAKKIAFEILKNYIADKISPYTASSPNFKANPSPFAKMLITTETSDPEIYDLVTELSNAMRDLLIYGFSENDLNSAKTKIIENFSADAKNFFNITLWTYYTEKHKLNKDFFEQYSAKISQLTDEEVKKAVEKITLPDNAAFVIETSQKKIICQLYSLAKFFKVNIFDKSMHRFKVIPEGFDEQFIINDYLNYCNANTNVKNLTIKFHADYHADTTYLVKGIIYKKYPGYYYYRTNLILKKDTLLQHLQIANDNFWLDSTALGAKFFDNKNDFNIRIYETYIFPELYYDTLEYEPTLVCDTSLMNKNIFKIKVTTSDNFYFYDYYDLNKKQKIKTEAIIDYKGRTDTLQIVEYYDYKPIGVNSPLIMPFTIKQTVNGIEFIMKIDEIDDKTKIKKSVFEITTAKPIKKSE